MRAFRAARQWVNQVPAQHVANSEISYFPGVSVEALTEAIVGVPSAWVLVGTGGNYS